MDHDPRDPPSGVEPLVLPAAAAVGGAVDAVAERRRGADEERLARACPEDVVRRRRQRERADRLRRLAIEHGLPTHPAVFGLPDAARGGADVGNEGVARFADHRDGAVTFGADEAVAQVGPEGSVRLLGAGHGNEPEKKRGGGAKTGHE